MSFGAPFGIPFGFAPPTSPALDDPRAQRRRTPIGPDEASPAAAGGAVGGMIPAGLLDALMRPSAERGSPDFDATFAAGQPGAGGSMPTAEQSPLVRGMAGLAGQMGGQPQQQPGRSPQPAVSPFSFAGAMPSVPMEIGTSRGFGPGSTGAGMPLPPGGAGPGASPIARAAAGQPLPFPGAPRATNAAAGAMAQGGAPLPPPRPTEFGGTGIWEQPEGTAAAPQAPNAGPGAPATAAAGGPSFLDRVGQGITQNASLFTSLGAGLMSTPGFGPGVAAGLKMHQDQQAKQEVAGIARAELGLRLKKSAEDATGLKGNQALAKAAFPNLTPEQLASNNSQLVTAAIAKLQNSNAGRDMKADSNGVQRWVDTGQPVFAGDEGKADHQLVDVQVGNGQTQKQWVKKGEATGVSVGQPGQTKPEVRAFKNPDGTESTRVLNPQTGTWEAPNYGTNPPAAAAIDPNIPPGVDPATYRKELAKKTVTQQSQATDRANQASTYIPILERAERAYEALGKPNALGATALGPLNASTPNRFIGGMFGVNSEKMRQEYEAAAKDLELAKAQISMKGQGSITDSERRLLALTLPRLDAADPETGLRTLRDLRGQFERTMSRERLPSYELNAQGQPRGGEKFQQQMLQRRRGSRFDELMGQGMSKEDAFARMQQEGL